jgi:hypothetical protein
MTHQNGCSSQAAATEEGGGDDDGALSEEARKEAKGMFCELSPAYCMQQKIKQRLAARAAARKKPAAKPTPTPKKGPVFSKTFPTDEANTIPSPAAPKPTRALRPFHKDPDALEEQEQEQEEEQEEEEEEEEDDAPTTAAPAPTPPPPTPRPLPAFAASGVRRPDTHLRGGIPSLQSHQVWGTSCMDARWTRF